MEIMVVVVFMVGLFLWSQYENKRSSGMDVEPENSQLNPDKATWEQVASEKLEQAGEQGAASERQPKGDGYIKQLLEERLGHKAPDVPSIREAPDFFGELSPETIRKLSVALGVEFADEARRLIALEHDAILKKREISLHAALTLHDKHYATQLKSLLLEQDFQSLLSQQEVAELFADRLKEPYAKVAKFVQANYVAQMVRQGNLDDGWSGSLNAHELFQIEVPEDAEAEGVEGSRALIVDPTDAIPRPGQRPAQSGRGSKNGS